MTKPADQVLYDHIKEILYEEYPKHSAYRSGMLVKRYKAAFRELYGPDEEPYLGNRKKETGLTRWFDELTPAQLKRAQSEKKKTGRVKRFDDEDEALLLGYLFKRSRLKNKKLDAFDPDTGKKMASFGDIRYQHYHDKTGLLPEKLNHGDPGRRRRYYQRHGNTAKKGSPKWFSHKILW